MDCSRCKHSKELKDGVYSMKDGITYYVVNGSGAGSTTCTKESVYSVTFLDGNLVCSDFERRDENED